jgi:hypothetical protein
VRGVDGSDSMQAQDIYTVELRRHLRRILAKTAALRFASGMLAFLGVAAWLFLGVLLWTVLTDSPPLWQLLTASRVAIVLLAGLFIYFVVFPLVRLPGIGKLAAEVEARKDFQDIVRAAYEFSGDEEVGRRYAPDLVREVIRRAVQSVAGLEVRFLFLTRRTLLFVPVSYGALLIVAILVLAKPAALFDTGQRVFSPRSSAAESREANLFAMPGDIIVLSGSDVEVSAVDFGRAERPVHLSYNLLNEFWKTEPTEPEEDLTDSAFKRYNYTFKNLRNSVSYYFVSGERKSTVHSIRVVHKPIVTGLQLRLTPPAYTGEPPVDVEDSGGNVKALEGTQVEVRGACNNHLQAAQVRFGEGAPEAVAFAGKTFHFEFTALEDGYYTMILEDTLHHRTDDPLVHTIEVFDDHSPSIDVLVPEEDPELPRNRKVELSFIAADDYGLDRASVVYRKGNVDDYSHTSIPLGEQRGKKEVARSFTWSVEGIDLFPGEYIEFFIEVQDNNVVTGPGVAKSRVFHMSAPTMAQLYEKIREEEAVQGSLMEEAIQEGEGLKERLDKIEREFMKTEKLEWSQKKEIDKAVSSQKSIQEKIEEIKKSLDESLQSLSDNQMTSQQIGEKLEEIHRLLEEINSEALKDYIEKLQAAMEKLEPEDIRKALEELSMSAEELLERLERTASLLEQIRKEQRMEELVRDSEKLMESQRELNEQTEAAGNDEDLKELSDKQAELAKQTDQMQKDIEAMMQEMDDAQAEAEMQQASDNLSQKKTSGTMRKASQKLSQGQKQEAQQDQDQAFDDLVNLFSKMSEAQMAMQTGMAQRASINLQRLAKQTLTLSFKEEELARQLRSGVSDEGATSVRSSAGEQLSYYKALEKLAEVLQEISMKTFLVPRSLLRDVGKALSSMQKTVISLEQDQAFVSYAHAKETVGTLNEVTIQLLETAKSCTAGSGGASSGLEQMMQQLLQGQQQMMQATQEMLALQALQEKLLQERQAEFDRLAGRQRSLKEIAEQIQKSFDEDKDVLGRLDRAIEDMEEVMRDLEGGVLDRSVVDKEQRIISRLLDAQRSVHTRDYEKTRTSETAEDIFSQKRDDGTKTQVTQTLREAIQRAMNLKAPGEFEDLIRLYFRALAEEAAANRDSE